MHMVNAGLKLVSKYDVVHRGDGRVDPPRFPSSYPRKSFKRASPKL